MSNTKKFSHNQLKFLRGIGHGLNPIVTIGQNGLSESVLEELETSLDHHELLKIKLTTIDRAERKELINQIITQTNSELVQAIGKICLIFRAADASEIELPRH